MSYGDVLFSLIPTRLQEVDSASQGMLMFCQALGAQAASDKALLDLLSLESCPLVASPVGVDRWLTSQGVFDLAVLPESVRRVFAVHLPKLRAATGTAQAMSECLRILGYTSPVVTPLFSTFAVPTMADFGNAANDPYVASGMSSPALGGAVTYSTETGDYAALFAQRALSVNTTYLSATSGSSVVLTLPAGMGASVTTSHKVWVENMDTALPVNVLAVSGDHVTINLTSVSLPSGAALFYLPQDILFPSRFVDLSVGLPTDWVAWVSDYLPLLTPAEAADVAGLSTANRKNILVRILLTQLRFLAQFSPCRCDFRRVAAS